MSCERFNILRKIHPNQLTRAGDEAGEYQSEVSFWQSRNSYEPEFVTVARNLMRKNPEWERVAAGFAGTIADFQRFSRRSFALFETLPVHTPALVEQPMVKHEGRDYYAYFASAADKVVFLAVLNGPDRREAFRRANAWINLCPRRELLGEISLMDLNGNPLK